MKKNKGITLIALVITIVVLLILSGVVLNSMKDGGIIGKAEQAKEEQNAGKVIEDERLKEYENILGVKEKETGDSLVGLYRAIVPFVDIEIKEDGSCHLLYDGEDYEVDWNYNSGVCTIANPGTTDLVFNYMEIGSNKILYMLEEMENYDAAAGARVTILTTNGTERIRTGKCNL